MQNLSSYLPLLLLVFVGAVLLVSSRSRKRTMQQHQDMLNALSYGDRVMTTSGLYGSVVSLDDDTVDIEIADGVVTTWLRAAIREKVADDHAEHDATDEVADDDADAVAVDAADDAHGADETAHEPASHAEVAPPLEQSKK